MDGGMNIEKRVMVPEGCAQAQRCEAVLCLFLCKLCEKIVSIVVPTLPIELAYVQPHNPHTGSRRQQGLVLEL